MFSSTNLNSQFDPEMTINSGQVFLWQRYGNLWYGVHGDHIFKISIFDKKSENYDKSSTIDNIDFYSSPSFDGWEKFVFRLDDNMNQIFDDLSKDVLMSKLIRKYFGLRLMRQDPFQCMISFACSSNTNIPMIRNMLNNLSRKFGKKIMLDEKIFYTFPKVERLYEASINEICSCHVGYRAKAIKSIVDGIIEESFDLDDLKFSSYVKAKEQLMKIYGIGNKIADCILLFSLEKLDAFPIDVWISRALSSHYYNLIENKLPYINNLEKKLTTNNYLLVSNAIRNYFGKYSGYAQQYLYYYVRNNEKRKW
jgi:N-glycosylase/DNA lyase